MSDSGDHKPAETVETPVEETPAENPDAAPAHVEVEEKPEATSAPAADAGKSNDSARLVKVLMYGIIPFLTIAVLATTIVAILVGTDEIDNNGVDDNTSTIPDPTTDPVITDDDLNAPLTALVVAILGGLFSLFITAILAAVVLQRPTGAGDNGKGDKMAEISRYIQEGAHAFLMKEYQYLLVYVAIFFVIIGPVINWNSAGTFVVGAFTSAWCGYLGMFIATRANVRTTYACRTSLSDGLRVSFAAGAVMGLSVTGFALTTLSLSYLIFGRDAEALAGFGFGASSIALFARVAGGVFTKAADVGADLVGKVEAGIPEDDPRNPAVIADNVGDNVGDVAGMGADLFESYVGSIIATAQLGARQFGKNGIAMPFYLATLGVVAAIIGVFLVRIKEKKNEPMAELQERLLFSIRFGIFTAALLAAGFGALPIFVVEKAGEWQIYISYVLGLVAGVSIGYFTEVMTSFSYGPTKSIAAAGRTGPATVVIQGFAVGMFSTVAPMVILVIVILAAWSLGDDTKQDGTEDTNTGGPYAIAISAVGMLSTLGVTLATDAYGPVADNAGGIAEMAELEPQVRERTDALDALGNTTAATGKGFAIGSAVLTSVALLQAYNEKVSPAGTIDFVNEDSVIPGILVGAAMPYIFAALTMTAVGKAAMSMIEEVRRQFRETPGLKEGAEGAKADYVSCVQIATQAALKEMILPALLAIIVPIVIGFINTRMLSGVLVGSTVSGFLLAVTMANAGGAWDNAKKYVESGQMIDTDGNAVAKGTETHTATVVGDTVGDPFKDTSGPSLNILIKMMSVLALLFAEEFAS